MFDTKTQTNQPVQTNHNLTVISKTIVVISSNSDSAVYSQTWFIRNELFREEEFEATSIFSSGFSQISTKELSLLIIGERFVFSLKDGHESTGVQKAFEIVSKIDGLLLNTGFNFNLVMPMIQEQDSNTSRDLFFNKDNYLNQLFDAPNSGYGLYMSKNYEGFRLKLDIKPTVLENAETREKLDNILYAFNYHLDLNDEDRIGQLKRAFESWPKHHDYSLSIINEFLKK